MCKYFLFVNDKNYNWICFYWLTYDFILLYVNEDNNNFIEFYLSTINLNISL